MPYSNDIRKETLRAITDVSHVPFWLDNPARPAPEPELTRDLSTDLLVIGAGFTGLWTALLAKEENPAREVILLEAGEVATGASGRNGGFMDASITHGLQNGLARWPKDFPTLLALGMKNLDQIEATMKANEARVALGQIQIVAAAIAAGDAIARVPGRAVRRELHAVVRRVVPRLPL